MSGASTQLAVDLICVSYGGGQVTSIRLQHFCNSSGYRLSYPFLITCNRLALRWSFVDLDCDSERWELIKPAGL